MKLYRSLKISKNTFFANKLRTILASLAISIGVATVIIMVAISQGAQQEAARRIQRLGTNLLTIKAGQVKKLMGREQLFGDVTTLKVRDAEAIVEELPGVKAAAPVQDRDIRVKYGEISTMAKVVGTTPGFKAIRNYNLTRGRFFIEEENKAGLRLAVIGRDIRENLFKDRDPLGEIIRIGRIPFEVIGELQPQGVSPDGANEDIQVLIPLRTALRRVFNVTYLKLVYVQVRERGMLDKVEEEIRQLLRERHRLDRQQKVDDFTIRSQLRAIEMEQESGSSFTMLTLGIAAISLLVGGIGILAVMLLAIKERTREIGLRRALGARARDILLQFLVEALLLGWAGGMMGTIGGIFAAWGIGIITAIPTAIPLRVVVLSLLFSVSVGLFFGVYPARKASFLEPVDALRSE